MLSNKEKRKYIKQIMLPEVGLAGQQKLRDAKVVIVGCGGLGCPVLLYLAAAGVGTIGIIDFDTVSVTNLHRQILFGNEDVGKFKSEIAISKLNKMHPEVTMIEHRTMFTEENAAELLKDYDIVVDGCDNFQTRYLVNDACVKNNKALVSGSILGNIAQIAVFNVQGSKNLRDLFPEAPLAEDVPDCSENGVMATIPGIAGTFMANETIKLIMGDLSSVNVFHIINCQDLSITKLKY